MHPTRLKPIRAGGKVCRPDGSWLSFGLILPGLIGSAGFLGAQGVSTEGAAGSTPSSLAAKWPGDRSVSDLDQDSQSSTDAIGALAPKARQAAVNLTTGVPPTDLPPIFRWGTVMAHPSVGYGATYGTGLLVGPGRSQSTLVQTLSPGLNLELGQNLKLDYDPRLVLYTAKGYHDTVNQAVTLLGATQRGDWSVNLNNHFGSTDNPLIETAQQTQQTINTTRLSASRSLTSEMSLNLDLTQMLRWTGNFNRTFSWSTTDSLNYRLRDNLSLGLIGALEYDQVSRSIDMTNERLQGSVQGSVGEKLSYSVTGGLEFREFLGITAGIKISPIFSGNVNYQFTEKTSIGASLSRFVNPSVFNDEFIQTTKLEGTLHQRLFEKLTLQVSGGYRQTKHSRTISSNSAVQADDPLVALGWIPPTGLKGYTFLQTDDYAFARFELSARILQRGTLTVFWLWSDNGSTLRALNFLSRQTGVRLSYGF